MSKNLLFAFLLITTVAISIWVVNSNVFSNSEVAPKNTTTKLDHSPAPIVSPETEEQIQVPKILNANPNSESGFADDLSDEETTEFNAHNCDPSVIDNVNSLLANADLDIPFEQASNTDGQAPLKASYEYLSHLDGGALDQLAKQGFRDAMAVRGEQLINSDDQESKANGQQLLYKAGVLGSTYSLTGLAVSYFDEYLKAIDNNSLEQAKQAYKNVHNTQHLIDRLAPIAKAEDQDFTNALKNEDLVSDDEITQSQKESLTQFNNARLNEGLPAIGDESADNQLAKARAVSKALKDCLSEDKN